MGMLGVWLAKGAVTFVGTKAAAFGWNMWGQSVLDVIGAWI